MSNQSGISAEQELLDVLSNSSQAETSTGLAIIVASIPDNSTSVQFNRKFDTIEELQSNLSINPLYIFIKDFSKNTDHYDFISYVPDSSPVRSKMLYASTKNTLLRQIGTNSIGKQILATAADEILDLLESAEDITKSPSAILTESEEIEHQIAEQQRAMRLLQMHPKGRKLVSQTNGSPTALSFDVVTGDSSIQDLLKEANVISFNIDLSNEQVQIIKKSTISKPEDLQIVAEHPTYTLYKNGELYYFIYSCPSGSKVKERMVYASNRLGFVKYLQDNEKITFSKIIEIGDSDELEFTLISSSTAEESKEYENNESSASSAQKFNRPKGPMRKRRT
ncbi:hypothetical protein KAFR_0K01410 [Kazachstania africana CBS 2517]|uniref:ADF-H domain-containing protein n=1 Tax=Kazachstania africana (strain ATCC 22294 / BCRC 22015 / CBS 2517 / CECT 1963 / NBRC 1671 / NRRL Y-8276) TaxID=1071382 RepID=H2B1J5_KAZAF|nr:hypothetical protein KAFR_0K01410 [Kazachstania africana CBS 2517]CCF60495.1 hypothetical protein KAFR_0K01410 [Kazachstania africana CBS 2517]